MQAGYFYSLFRSAFNRLRVPGKDAADCEFVIQCSCFTALQMGGRFLIFPLETVRGRSADQKLANRKYSLLLIGTRDLAVPASPFDKPFSLPTLRATMRQSLYYYRYDVVLKFVQPTGYYCPLGVHGTLGASDDSGTLFTHLERREQPVS